MNFIILGDKFQRRMKSKGCVALFKTQNNKPIIHNQYKYIKKFFPESQIHYIAGFEYKKLQTFVQKNIEIYSDLNIVYNKNYDKYNDIYSISLIKEILQDECFILFGDNILKNNIFTKFQVDLGSQIYIDTQKNEGIGCILYNNYITNISYDLDNKLSNIYYLSKSHCVSLCKIIESNQYNNFFVFELINKLIDQNKKFKPLFI